MYKPTVATSRIGMWHRPFERNLQEVRQTLVALENLGVTDLFVETYFNGQLIMDSLHSLLNHHAFVGHYEVYGRNLLKAFVEEGKKKNIRVHAWVENFFVGRFDHVEDSFWHQHHPTWILKNRDGSSLQKNEVNYLFLDPAHPEVRAYTRKLYQEILAVEHLESLHLDYIRYPLMYDITPPNIFDDVGYTEGSLNEFSTLNHLEGSIIELLATPKVYQAWCTYRIGVIDSFVHEVYQLAKEKKVGLSAAVFGNPEHAIKHKMQDWNTWLQKGWLKLIIPMAYYKDSSRVFDEVKQMKSRLPKDVLMFAGIAPFMMHLSVDEHKAQYLSSLKAGADGVAMFASQHYLGHHDMKENVDYIKIVQMFEEVRKKENSHETLD